MNECAVCGEPTDNPEHWGCHVCRECADRPVLFVARCESWECQWSATEEGREYKRGQAKQAIQREANTHEKRKRIIERVHGHAVFWWEMDHPDRDRLLPSEVDE